MSIYSTMNIASRALQTHKAVMDVIGQNIGNVNTPGYTRRVAQLVATDVGDARYGSLGTGVDVASIEQKRALFLDGRFRSETAAAAEFDVKSGFLTRVEGALNEPGDSGISGVLDSFFAGWAALANDPTEAGLKSDLVGRAEMLSGTVQNVYQDITHEIQSADEALVLRVEEMNRGLAEVADLNGRINELEVGGQRALDLRDRRDLVLDQLSALAPIRITEETDGMVSVHLSGRTMVDGTMSRQFETRERLDGSRTRHELTVAGSQGDVRIEGGVIGALQTIRDETLPDYLDTLDAFAARLIEEVNTIHRQGPAGLDFFSGNGASDISVANAVSTNPASVQVSSAMDGNNDLALAMVALAEKPQTELGSQTFSEFYRGFVVTVGGESAAASFGQEAHQASLDQVRTHIEQVEGVSLDEEMANMIAAEHAYEAAARLMTTASKMLETLMSIG